MHHNTVKIKHLSYRYPDGRLALNKVSLRIEAGEKVALIGPNGAGKSTLLLHLNGLLLPQTGSVHVCDIKVTKENVAHVRSAVGLVFQDPNDQLFSPTVFEDIAYGLVYRGLPEPEIRKRVHWALEAVGMGSYAERVTYHLSLGEKKRIAIATVLPLDPDILVLDEPTAGLDPRARRELVALLESLPITQLIATHDLALASTLCSRTVVMDEGEVVADGPSEVVLADSDLLLAHGLA